MNLIISERLYINIAKPVKPLKRKMLSKTFLCILSILFREKRKGIKKQDTPWGYPVFYFVLQKLLTLLLLLLLQKRKICFLYLF